jgi:SAM-dependent methyltransferase
VTGERKRPSAGSEFSTPFNYRYFLSHAAALGGRILDYGCGTARVVAMGRNQGLDIWGVDTYADYYRQNRSAVAEDARNYVRPIEDGRAVFDDAHFDVVLSNQVLEHVSEPERVIADMSRVLRPGGTLIAAFPVESTWYEGHVGIYFAHRLPPGRTRHAMFVAAHRLGFGICRGSLTSAEWSTASEQILDDVCFYHPKVRVFSALRAIGPIEDLSTHYMRTRLGKRVRFLPDAFLRFVYHKRAGEIFRLVKECM